MQTSPTRFAEILTTAVLLSKALNGRNLDAIQDELGFALGREGASFIQYLRKGHVPSSVEDALALTRELIRLKGLTTLRDCEQFLKSAGVPRAKENARELWHAAEAKQSPSKSPENMHAFVVGPPITRP